MNTITMPSITVSEDRAHYEVTLPSAGLPDTITNVTLSPDGLYIELANGRWDLIPFAELADLVDDAGARIHAKAGRNGKPAARATILNIPVVGTIISDPVHGNRVVFTS